MMEHGRKFHWAFTTIIIESYCQGLQKDVGKYQPPVGLCDGATLPVCVRYYYFWSFFDKGNTAGRKQGASDPDAKNKAGDVATVQYCFIKSNFV